jgi:F0F1-type ATP synthase assembly protein I
MADEKKNGKKQWVGAEKYIQLGISLPAGTFIGWAIGAALDHWLHTTWIYIAGLILGIVAGFVQLIRIAMSGAQD